MPRLPEARKSRVASGVGEELVMHGRRLAAELRAGRRERLPGADVLGRGFHQEKVEIGLVEGDEFLDPVAERVDDDLGVVAKPLDRLAIAPGALLLQRLRQVPMEERDHRLDAGGDQIVDQAAVVGEAGRVHLAGALGQDARPGDREAVGVDAELAHQRDVGEILIAVIGVDRDVAGLLLADHRLGDAVAVGVDVPVGEALAVGLPTALDLVGGARRPPEKIPCHGRSSCLVWSQTLSLFSWATLCARSMRQSPVVSNQ